MSKRREKRDRDEQEARADPFINDDGDGEDIDGEDGPPVIDPYEVLQLDQEATTDEVKKAYRKMALKHHPGMRSPPPPPPLPT
jgi:DnaJ family protein C protein 9